jgi:hypothetical protein
MHRAGHAMTLTDPPTNRFGPLQTPMQTTMQTPMQTPQTTLRTVYTQTPLNPQSVCATLARNPPACKHGCAVAPLVFAALDRIVG